MSASFFDSNVPLYLLGSELQKTLQAQRMLLVGGVLSVQVLNEVVAVSRRNYTLEWPRIRKLLTELCKLVEVVPLTLATHELGIRLAERYQFHIYDAMIVAAALEADCDTLYTEDMQHGLRIDDRLTIVNPFA
jgi:predicted nucleic acid-binding protein